MMKVCERGGGGRARCREGVFELEHEGVFELEHERPAAKRGSVNTVPEGETDMGSERKSEGCDGSPDGDGRLNFDLYMYTRLNFDPNLMH
jgi:hypothetical protein